MATPLHLHMFCLTAFLSVSLVNAGEGGKTDLYIVSMLPYPQQEKTFSSPQQATWDDGPDIIPAIHLALDQINNQTNVLSDYTLKLIEVTDGCNQITTTYLNFVSIISSSLAARAVVVGVIGPRCSDSALAVAPLITYSRIATISIHLGTVPSLGNRTLFPYSFSILDSASLYVKALFELTVRNNWTTVGVLYSEADAYYYTIQREFNRRVRTNPGYNVQLSAPVSESYIPLQEVRDSHARVVFVLMRPSLTLQFLCLAYHDKLSFPTYQWIFVHRLLEDVDETCFLYNRKEYCCSGDEIRSTMEGAISLVFSLELQAANDTETVSGETIKDYSDQYGEKIKQYNENHVNNQSSTTVWANPVYDAVWALAIALNASIEILKSENDLTLSDYNNNKEVTTKIVAEQLYHVNFTGVSGMISFDRNTGFTNRTLEVYQFQMGLHHPIGYYDGEILNVTGVFISSGVDLETIHVLTLPLAICILVIISVPLLLTVSTQIISIIYRRFKPIKASSYRLNQIAYLGCYLLTAGIIISTVIETFYLGKNMHNALCIASPWSLNIGLTLVLGTMCVKSWRVYRILAASSKLKSVTNQLYLKDHMLSLGVLALVTVEVILLAIRTATDRPTHTEYSTRFYSESLPFIKTVTTCGSENQSIWLSAEIAYKTLISLMAFVFALCSRKGRQKGFEVKNVIILAYIQVLVSGFITPSAIVVNFSSFAMDAFALFLILFAYFGVILYVCVTMLFVPPIVLLIKGKWSQMSKETSFWSTHPPRRKPVIRYKLSSLLRPSPGQLGESETPTEGGSSPINGDMTFAFESPA